MSHKPTQISQQSLQPDPAGVATSEKETNSMHWHNKQSYIVNDINNLLNDSRKLEYFNADIFSVDERCTVFSTIHYILPYYHATV